MKKSTIVACFALLGLVLFLLPSVASASSSSRVWFTIAAGAQGHGIWAGATVFTDGSIVGGGSLCLPPAFNARFDFTEVKLIGTMDGIDIVIIHFNFIALRDFTVPETGELIPRGTLLPGESPPIPVVDSRTIVNFHAMGIPHEDHVHGMYMVVNVPN